MHAQVDPRKLDSLAHKINASARAIKHYQDSFDRSVDSMYHSRIVLARTKQNKRDSVQWSENKPGVEGKIGLTSIMAGIVFLIVLILLVFRVLRKTNRN